jgi:hypothetical protein
MVAVLNGLIELTQSTFNPVYTFNGNFSASSSFANAGSNGTIVVAQPPYQPSWINAGYVSGMKYYAALNGVINTQGQSQSWFPGNVAGGVAGGGQYA